MYNYEIYQFAYLLDNTNGDCQALFAPTEQDYFIMGTPYFRMNVVAFDYNITSIFIEPGLKSRFSPITYEWGPYNPVYEVQAAMTIVDYSITYSVFYVAGQGSVDYQMTLDTAREWTIIPGSYCTGCYYNWFDETATGVTVYDYSW